MANTLKRGYPYPVPGITPDVPYWNQQLAEKIDTDVDQLFGVQALQGRGALASKSSAATISSITSETFVAAIDSILLKKGRTYRVTLRGAQQASTADNAVRYRIRKSSTDPALVGTITGTNLDDNIIWTHANRANAWQMVLYVGYYTPTADETVRLFMTAERSDGTGTVTLSANTGAQRVLYVEDTGIF